LHEYVASWHAGHGRYRAFEAYLLYVLNEIGAIRACPLPTTDGVRSVLRKMNVAVGAFWASRRSSDVIVDTPLPSATSGSESLSGRKQLAPCSATAAHKDYRLNY